MNHDEAISINAVEGYLLDDLSVGDSESFEEHMAGCSVCAHDLLLLLELRDVLRGDPSFDARFHTRHAVVAYVLDDLPPTERDVFEKHVFTCQPCAQQLKVGKEILQELQLNLAGQAAPGTRLLAALRFCRWFQLAFGA